MTRLLFSADLHGNRAQYAQLVRRAAREEIDAIVLGGDLLPYGNREIDRLLCKDDTSVETHTVGMPAPDFAQGTPARQRAFLREAFPRFLDAYRAARPDGRVYVVIGNDDLASVEGELRAVCVAHGAIWLHGTRAALDRTTDIVGYGHTPLSPFTRKDGERNDTASGARDAARRMTRQGWKSNDDHFVRVDASHFSASLEERFAEPWFSRHPERTIYAVHTPPYGGPLDLARYHLWIGDTLHVAREHIGSIALREFIERAQPLLTLHGHVHETVRLSGAYAARIGATHSYAAGNTPRSTRAAAIIVDTQNPAGGKRVRLG